MSMPYLLFPQTIQNEMEILNKARQECEANLLQACGSKEEEAQRLRAEVEELQSQRDVTKKEVDAVCSLSVRSIVFGKQYYFANLRFY